MNRNIRTIAWNILHRKGGKGAAVPDAIFHISVQFIVAISLVFFTFTLWWLKWFYVGDESRHIIVVNAPTTFQEYATTYNHKFIYKDWGASYDYVTFGDWMHEEDAYMTVVFPENFDEVVLDNDITTDTPDILTFYRTNSLEYMDWKEDFLDTCIGGYEEYLAQKAGIITSSEDNVHVYVDGISTSKEDIYSGSYFLKSMAQTFFPIIIFISILYFAMSSGTNVIAGEKERGTFAAILMTPVRRIDIVIGNTIGVAIKSVIPALVGITALFIIPFYREHAGIIGILNAYILVISLAIFISAITILISVINDSVVSAQTAFLPIFLIMVAVCVTCIQEVKDAAAFYYLIPVYGHFYGIGSSIIGTSSILYTVLCFVISLIFAGICIIVSEKLLHKERFTVSGDQITDRDIRKAEALIKKQSTDYVSKPKVTVFGFKGSKRTSAVSFISDQILYPLAVLSIFQLLALIPTVILYMRKPEYSAFIYSLKSVKSIPDIFSKAFEIMAIFMGDPLFLVFMSLGYVGIIVTYILRVKLRESGNSPVKTLGFIGAGKKYFMGLILGLILMGNVYLLLIVTGQLVPSIPPLSVSSIVTIFAGILMWIPQGAAEEVMFRGYMLPRQGARFGIRFALIFSSILFALFHSMNVGFTPLAFINLFLIAYFFALLDYKVGHIWYSCGAHSMWNFLQGNVFGLQVSGNQGAATLIHANYTTNAKDIITGGSFGPEGGLAVTFITIIAIIAVDYAINRSRKSTEKK